MKQKCQLLRLSSQFYQFYNEDTYPEILRKNKRAYSVVVCIGNGDYYICAPFRSEIRHSQSFIFKKTLRSNIHKSGIDYKKIVIIRKIEYINWKDIPIIDNEEYLIFLKYNEKIGKQMIQYVERYILHIKNTKRINEKEFERLYRFSSLPYFHEELGLLE